MAPTTPPSSDELWAQEQEDSIRRNQAKRRADKRLWAIVVAIALTVGALYPALIGIGPFGIKSFRAEAVQLWVYNTTEGSVGVETAFRAPLAYHHQIQIVPMGVERFFLKTGKRTLLVHQGGETTRTPFELTNHTIVTIGQQTCYAAFDVTDFYDEAKSHDADLRLVERIPAGTFIYTAKADSIVVPRQAMPRRAFGSIHWIEDFDCSLLDPAQEELLMMRARVKLEAREEAMQEALQR